MNRMKSLLCVFAMACVCSLSLFAEDTAKPDATQEPSESQASQDQDTAEQAYRRLDWKQLKKEKGDINAKPVMLAVGLGSVTHEPFPLNDPQVTLDDYTAVEVRKPGKTKAKTKSHFNAYIRKDSKAMDVYKLYNRPKELERTWEHGINIWGTAYYLDSKGKYPYALIVDKIQPTKFMPKGNLRYSIMVRKFENKSNWKGQWALGDAFTEMMTDTLHECDWFIVLGDKVMRQEAIEEQDFAAGGRAAKGKKAPKIGRMTTAQLLVKGAITHVQQSTTGGKGGINIKGIRLGGKKDSAEVNITLYLVDSETGQVKASTRVVGQSDRKGGGLGYYGSRLGGLTGQLEGFKKDNVGKACQDAIGQAVTFLVEQLDDIAWEGTVMLAKPGKIIINRGSREGVTVGKQFLVVTMEELVDEDTGEVLDVDMEQVGLLEVTKVKEKVAHCKALEGAEQIKKSMTVVPKKKQ